LQHGENLPRTALHVLGRLIRLEAAQAVLLDKIRAGPLCTSGELEKLWASPAPSAETAS
jgi:hypothetical protein